MEQRIFHGNISPSDFASDLIAHFNRGNWQVQQVGSGSKISIQIATRERPTAGGQTALIILLQSVEDGVSVKLGKQSLLGIAASMGFTALATAQNPFNLLGRFDDLAQDIENLQLSTEALDVIETTARSIGTGYEISERLKRIVCEYCNSGNPIGQSRCIACGAPLGDVQPDTCKYCGFVIKLDEKTCPNCKKPL